MPVHDMAGFHSSKVNNVLPDFFEVAEEAVAATRRRHGIDDSKAHLIHNEERESFSISLGDPEAKRAFDQTCRDLAEENPSRSNEFELLRSLTIGKIKDTRVEAGLGRYEDTPGGGGR